MPDQPTHNSTVSVLVVEDDRAAREALDRALRREGYDVSTGADGRQTSHWKDGLRIHDGINCTILLEPQIGIMDPPGGSCQQAIVIPDYVTSYLSNNLNKTGKSFRFQLFEYQPIIYHIKARCLTQTTKLKGLYHEKHQNFCRSYRSGYFIRFFRCSDSDRNRFYAGKR